MSYIQLPYGKVRKNEKKKLKLTNFARNHKPYGIQRHSDVSLRSYIGRDLADRAKTSSRRRNWNVN